jgi:pimeloyl-ACP methyl ester carboxylesterase
VVAFGAFYSAAGNSPASWSLRNKPLSACYSWLVDSNFAVRQMTRAGRAHALTYPKTFRVRQVAANGTKLYVRVGGRGPAVVLLHGYGETGDMWVALGNDLARDHTVVVPDLRGMGLSAKPAGGTTRKRKPATLQVFSMRSRSSERVMRYVASDVEEGVVPDSGHWIMEENPKATIALVRGFLNKGH